MVDASDRRNLEAASTGDREACAALVTLYGPLALGVCRRVLGAGVDADSVFQTVFLDFLKRGPRLSRRVDPALWLHRSACRAARRARGGASAEATVDSRSRGRLDLRRMIDDDIDDLWRARGPVILCALMNLSPEKAAERLGLSIDQVERRLDRGFGVIDARLRRRVERAAPGTIAPFLSWQDLGDVPVPSSLFEEILHAAAKGVRTRWSAAFAADSSEELNPPRVAVTAISRLRSFTTSSILVVGMGAGASYAALMGPEALKAGVAERQVEVATPAPSVQTSGVAGARIAIIARLNEPFSLKTAEPIQLDEFLDRVREATQTPEGVLLIHVDLAGLKRVGASLSSPVALDTNGATLGETLRRTLAQAGLAYEVDGGRLVVTAAKPEPEEFLKELSAADARKLKEKLRLLGHFDPSIAFSRDR
ncbi:RNA polymerase sigma factor [Paludisphaera rhizosphaerae]|uniref:RNA polymerase sigma factor n=1 Tax=Paludisphaera rhizosphaerae TaxID=2711216 RepID=UPI0013EB9274|nr:sigma factor [Paludisphaera rhizosphaerae]